jgi:rRNA biogenesis protein RRP5
MAKPSTGKTRTTTAHGPTASKKAFKAGPTVKPKPSSSSSAPTPTPREGKTVRTFPSATAAAAFKPSTTTPSYGKRKADEGAAAGKEEPEKARVPSTLLNTPEEIDFPRGGGTNLTQVEVREAQLEGEKEARDEQAEEDLRDGTTAEGVEKSKTKRRKLERALQGAVKEKNLLPKDAFRVEHLNYKVQSLHLSRTDVS